MSGLSTCFYGRTAMAMFQHGIAKHKEMYDGAYPYRVTLSADWKEAMQHATALVVDGHEVIIGYRRNQDRHTISCDTTKQGNRGWRKREKGGNTA